MTSNKIQHHNITLKLDPNNNKLHAVDIIEFSTKNEFLFYLGNRFDIISIEQENTNINHSIEEEGKIFTRYKVPNINPNEPIKIEWEGKLDSFQGYKVCMINESLVELSGFCWWFPTAEQSSQLEEFTYDIKINLPDDWTLVTPGKQHNNTYRYDRYIEDIFLCASPDLKLFQEDCCDIQINLYIPRNLTQHSRELMDDFTSSIKMCTSKFGQLKEGNAGTGVISPRGEDGAEWGFERDGLWVVGDQFASFLLNNDWIVNDLPKSLSLHETIHGWFGIGVNFEEPWLCEAITQYLEVLLTSEMFRTEDIDVKYFEQYRNRTINHIKEEDKPIDQYTFLDDMYTHWYLKGSWAFWDLEGKTGREPLLDFFKTIYQEYLEKTITYSEFKTKLNETFDINQHFLEHWFETQGFDPIYR